MIRRLDILILAVFAGGTLLTAMPLRAQQEVILQYFNTSWNEINERIPEVAEAGYSALWLPPPCKGASGGFSVGYDPFDRFDLGDRNQSGTVRTRYGTKAELLRLIEKAHRFGLRVYLDNVMAHNAGPLDDVGPTTFFPGLPGFVPADFHLVRRSSGGWRKASDSINYNDEWQVLNRNPFAWDIAQEEPNTSFDPAGQTEGLDYPKWSGVRHAGKTWLYPDDDLAGVTDANGVVFHPFADREPFVDANGNGRFDWTDTNGNGQHDANEPCESFTDTGVDPTNPNRQSAGWAFGDGRYNMGDPVAEDVNSMLIRANRWTVDQTKCDGFRLDAVKHVPSYFFGQRSGDVDPASTGYLGRAQAQFNLTRGFEDWSNHRNSTYSTNATRDDLMLFGEHLGAPPNPNDYLAAGMRIANDNFLNDVGSFNGIGADMGGYDQPGHFTFGVSGGVMYCLSHDNNSMAGSERPAAHQYMLTRAGIPIIYTDGYNIAGGPDYFPKPSHVPFLGQYGHTYVTGALTVRRDFMRGDQWPRWASRDLCGWEWRDYSENPGMAADAAVILVVMHARSYASGQQMPFGTVFPANHRLRNHSPFNGSFFANVGADGKLRGDDGNIVVVPNGGYFAFSYDVPGLPDVWEGSSKVHQIDVFDGGVQVPTIGVVRKDGRDGDAAYRYTAQIPLVRGGTNLRFVARADGSAASILMKLDGGVDLNAQMGAAFTAGRDNRPGTANDTFLGYEQMRFVHRVTEKFAAKVTNTGRDSIGSPGAETWQCTPGTSGFTRDDGGGVNTDTDTANWVYHDPEAANINGETQTQFFPAPAAAAAQPITVWVKIGYEADDITKAWCYYTTDGATYPEGSAGEGRGTTQIAAMTKHHNAAADGGGTPEWWRGTIPALPAGTVLRYKIGVHHVSAASRFPDTADQISKKEKMETLFEIADFNARTVQYYPHNDLNERATGLREGFHVLRSRAFLPRSGKASLFRTHTQTFYYDIERPSGSVIFPAENSTIGGSTYGFVVLTDASVTGVAFNILDSNDGNDSPANGNGTGNWAAAGEVTPTQLGSTGFAREWRFDYRNVPLSGAAVVRVRLREASSSADDLPDDAAGWFTTITRNVSTGNAVNYRIQFPGVDGTVVDANYVAKVYFNKSLGTGVSDAQMLAEFTATLDDVLIPRAGYSLLRNETATESAFAFRFPNFYNGIPKDLHELRATHQRGDISLTDTRLVKASPGAVSDSDGDGLPDYWESANRLDANSAFGDHGAAGDPDNDGFTNADEYAFNTGPLDARQVSSLAIETGKAAGRRLVFPVFTTRRYTVQTSADLVTWTDAGPEFTPLEDSAGYEWPDPAAVAGRRCYRLRVRVP